MISFNLERSMRFSENTGFISSYWAWRSACDSDKMVYSEFKRWLRLLISLSLTGSVSRDLDACCWDFKILFSSSKWMILSLASLIFSLVETFKFSNSVERSLMRSLNCFFSLTSTKLGFLERLTSLATAEDKVVSGISDSASLVEETLCKALSFLGSVSLVME
ncbi:hypothetical protein WICPIJ_003125 [Wickerhamomyces pijperi]|uniref:Uncharacterized protein n=1 Tax=Wickerhamomyces pijperi TaxID=599730 RepID=A0A9P8QAI7_WICPI|nr:hypothetical protein WICPIJ_003125 [Wickerhamomyces pijperi]